MAESILRKKYLHQLIQWKDTEVIKVISGVRRCGKSVLLKQYSSYLEEQNAGNIIYLNFEKIENEAYMEYHALYNYVIGHLSKEHMNYVMLDEVQLVEHYERAVDSLQLMENVDIVITGSNAYLLSGELATLLSGRYIEIKMLPLSFAEYYQGMEPRSPEDAFTEYLRYGSLPYVKQLSGQEAIDQYLEGIYNTIIVRDIEEREERRKKDGKTPKITDMTLLKNISRYMAGSAGNYLSIKNISGYITSTGRKVSPNTVADYVEALVEPFLYYPVERYDVNGKSLLKTNCKYYIVDQGLRRHLVARSNYDLGATLENIIFLELLRRGYTVNVGKVGNLEIDFLARKGDSLTYFQVTADMTAEETFNREIAPLKKVRDNYEKIILTLDRYTLGTYEGIKVIHALDWLLNEITE